MAGQSSLRQRLTTGIVLYTILLSLAVAAQGYFVNERAEQLVWTSMLETEYAHFKERVRLDPDFHWVDTNGLRLFGLPGGAPMPDTFSELAPGVHDEIFLGAEQFVVLVKDEPAGRLILALEISNLEADESSFILSIVLSSIVMVIVLAVLTQIGAGALLRPLTNIAAAISRLNPDREGERIPVPANAPGEAVIIAGSLNDHLERIDAHVKREREFINLASHELRTPIAVISGAAEVALDRVADAETSREILRRVLATTRDMQRLMVLLLALAKDPGKLQAGSESIDLAELVPSIVEDHCALATERGLRMATRCAAGAVIHAPVQIVRAAIGNLLRNAIENSRQGVISIEVGMPARVTIRDQGSGLSDEELALIYTKLARSGQGTSRGIGIELIARLCEHLGWRLGIESSRTQGTTANLEFAASGPDSSG
jgi:signal transduction histidine kinase